MWSIIQIQPYEDCEAHDSLVADGVDECDQSVCCSWDIGVKHTSCHECSLRGGGGGGERERERERVMDAKQ